MFRLLLQWMGSRRKRPEVLAHDWFLDEPAPILTYGTPP